MSLDKSYTHPLLRNGLKKFMVKQVQYLPFTHQ